MLKRWHAIILTTFLAACTSAGTLADQPAKGNPNSSAVTSASEVESEDLNESPKMQRADLDNFGPAPELSNEVWLNTDKPLRLEDLRGNVVLLDMWTFG